MVEVTSLLESTHMRQQNMSRNLFATKLSDVESIPREGHIDSSAMALKPRRVRRQHRQLDYDGGSAFFLGSKLGILGVFKASRFNDIGVPIIQPWEKIGQELIT